MKVSVLTLEPNTNYGGILQAVALCGYLEALGLEVSFIRKKTYRPIWQNLVLRLLERTPYQNIRNKRREFLKRTALKEFVDEYLPQKQVCISTSKQFCEWVEEHSPQNIIVGSDQVWRYKYINDGHYDVFFLPTAKPGKVKKISYAASFGLDYWEAKKEVEHVRNLITEFDYVSVREQQGLKICRETFGLENVTHVLDPTLLVNESFYDRFLDSNKDAKNNIITTYILDEDDNKNDIVEKVNQSLQPDSIKKLSSYNSTNFLNVDEWLQGIRDAEFVITDSFHGMLFSIIFRKNFLVIKNVQRGSSRFESFLRVVGLEDRLISSSDIGAVASLAMTPVDYVSVEGKLYDFRASSESFLKKALFN